jgi:hypothetical protein
MEASQNGHAEVAGLLVAAGADVQARDEVRVHQYYAIPTAARSHRLLFVLPAYLA